MTDTSTNSPTEYSDDEFLDAFTTADPSADDVSALDDEHVDSLGPYESTTRVIAERVGCTVQTANRRLAELANAGDVEFLNPDYTVLVPSTSKELIVRRIPEDGTPIYDLEARLLGEERP